jgi:hypothetical protein
MITSPVYHHHYLAQYASYTGFLLRLSHLRPVHASASSTRINFMSQILTGHPSHPYQTPSKKSLWLLATLVPPLLLHHPHLGMPGVATPNRSHPHPSIASNPSQHST